MIDKPRLNKGKGRHELTFEERSKGGLKAWSQSTSLMIEGASRGGLKTSKIERTCHYCERVIIGPGYFRHLKKCYESKINN